MTTQCASDVFFYSHSELRSATRSTAFFYVANSERFSRRSLIVSTSVGLKITTVAVNRDKASLAFPWESGQGGVDWIGRGEWGVLYLSTASTSLCHYMGFEDFDTFATVDSVFNRRFLSARRRGRCPAMLPGRPSADARFAAARRPAHGRATTTAAGLCSRCSASRPRVGDHGRRWGPPPPSCS